MIQIDKLVRSNRRTLSLIVEPDGTLTVRAPSRMTEADIRRFIDVKADWIKRKQAVARKEAIAAHRYVDGETFLYLGKEIPLRLLQDQRPALVMDGTFKLTRSAWPQAESVFEAWYKKQARAVLTERAEFFARKYRFNLGKIRITSARTRWGSCSAKQTLSFTWRLVMASLEVIDYVVVHELCHLRELNHSRSFWAQVESILPDYESHRKWLKQNGAKLKL
jgi:predicted metal-dependent hydrolase